MRCNMTRETAGGRAPVCGHADEGQTVNLGAKPKQLLLRDYGNTWFMFFEKGDTETLQMYGNMTSTITRTDTGFTVEKVSSDYQNKDGRGNTTLYGLAYVAFF